MTDLVVPEIGAVGSASDGKVCSAWCSVEDVQGCKGCEALTSDQIEPWIAVASDLLYDYSGSQFPGICSTTVRPVNTCACLGSCACSCVQEVVLSISHPIVQVTEVKVDGDVLASGLYTVLDGRTLIRLPDETGYNPGLPCCQDVRLATTETGTWEVSFDFGRVPPPAGIQAAAILACEFAKAASGAECNLPARTVSTARQGVTINIADPLDLIDKGKTGIYLVDVFLGAVNPGNLRESAQMFNPDLVPGARHVGP